MLSIQCLRLPDLRHNSERRIDAASGWSASTRAATSEPSSSNSSPNPSAPPTSRDDHWSFMMMLQLGGRNSWLWNCAQYIKYGTIDRVRVNGLSIGCVNLYRSIESHRIWEKPLSRYINVFLYCDLNLKIVPDANYEIATPKKPHSRCHVATWLGGRSFRWVSKLGMSEKIVWGLVSRQSSEFYLIL